MGIHDRKNKHDMAHLLIRQWLDYKLEAGFLATGGTLGSVLGQNLAQQRRVEIEDFPIGKNSLRQQRPNLRSHSAPSLVISNNRIIQGTGEASAVLEWKQGLQPGNYPVCWRATV